MSTIAHLAQVVQVVHDHAHLLAEPSPDPGTPVKHVDTNGIFTFLATVVAPILVAVVGVVVIARAKKGDMSTTLSSSAIALIGMGLIAGAFVWFAVGQYLVGLVIH